MAEITIYAKRPASSAETGSSPDLTGSPIGHVYRLEIPTGWMALRVVFFPEHDGSRGSDVPDIRAAVDQGFRSFQAGVLLCRPETDGGSDHQGFSADALPERAFLIPADQFEPEQLNHSAYAVLPLVCSSQAWMGQSSPSECLVLMPLVSFPFQDGDHYGAPRLFVDGVEV